MSNKFVDFFKDIKGFRFTSKFFIRVNAVQNSVVYLDI